MNSERAQRLADFVTYARTLSGDEKGEAQVFLDRLFRDSGPRRPSTTLADTIA